MESRLLYPRSLPVENFGTIASKRGVSQTKHSQSFLFCNFFPNKIIVAFTN